MGKEPGSLTRYPKTNSLFQCKNFCPTCVMLGRNWQNSNRWQWVLFFRMGCPQKCWATKVTLGSVKRMSYTQVSTQQINLKAYSHQKRTDGRIDQTNWWIHPWIKPMHCSQWECPHLNFNLSPNWFRNQKIGFCGQIHTKLFAQFVDELICLWCE